MKKAIIYTGVLVITIICWYFLSMFSSPLFLPTPQSVFESFKGLVENGMLPKGLLKSFTRITIATLFSGTISIIMSLLIYNFKSVKFIFRPLVNVMRYIPVTAFYPLLIMWLGIDELMKISFLFIATFVYMLPSVLLAFEDVNVNLIDTGLTIGMNKFQVIYKILFPYSLPSICKTFLMMYGIGWTYIVVAETVNAVNGLGYIINISSSRGRTDMVFVCIICIMLFSILFDKIGNKIINKVFKWSCNNDRIEKC